MRKVLLFRRNSSTLRMIAGGRRAAPVRAARGWKVGLVEVGASAVVGEGGQYGRRVPGLDGGEQPAVAAYPVHRVCGGFGLAPQVQRHVQLDLGEYLVVDLGQLAVAAEP